MTWLVKPPYVTPIVIGMHQKGIDLNQNYLLKEIECNNFCIDNILFAWIIAP